MRFVSCSRQFQTSSSSFPGTRADPPLQQIHGGPRILGALTAGAVEALVHRKLFLLMDTVCRRCRRGRGRGRR